jgi:hypothetical protein
VIITLPEAMVAGLPRGAAEALARFAAHPLSLRWPEKPSAFRTRSVGSAVAGMNSVV